MDCDGMKHVILTATDGSFSETYSFRTIISRAEFQWNGDRRRGIGDYHIPNIMVTRPDGSQISVDQIYLQKRAVWSNTFNGTDECSFNPGWNMYLCQNLEHILLVMESLDEDTGRLSPIGISANGFKNLLNGPMDHGWCGGHTCQERISTFYGIVASFVNYIIGLSSVNAQKFALHLINARDEQGIVARIIYIRPQRLDMYIDNGGEDVYIPPKNAKILEDGNLEYVSDSNVPVEPFFPTIDDDEHGANFNDRSLKQLNVNVKGKQAYKIITTPVIVLSVTLQVTTEEFFAEEFLVRNLAMLLNIPEDRIRVVNVVRETSKKRRKKRQAATEMIEFEIGDPPTKVIVDASSNSNMSANMTMNMTMLDNSTNTVNVTNTTRTLSFQKLMELTETVAEAVQTGEILQGSSDVALVDAEVEEPIPEPVDPTGGVRAATNATGGPQLEDIGENSTLLTYAEKQNINETAELNKTDVVVRLSLPTLSDLTKKFTNTIVEGLPLSFNDASQFTMYDNNGVLSETLGIGISWKVSAIKREGPQNGFLINHVIDFIKGQTSFQGTMLSHPGTYCGA